MKTIRFLRTILGRPAVILTLLAVFGPGCSSGSNPADGAIVTVIDARGPDGPEQTPVVISAANPVPRVGSWGINYWQWMPDFGDGVTGTADLIKTLKPAYLRIGGYNNDINAANPFDDAAFDRAIAYARAIGAEPILQVPLLADLKGQPPTAATAAAMVGYSVSKGYGVKYYSIGNEPDLYATQGLPVNGSQPALPGYTPAAYCAQVRAFVAAMKAVDPTIRIIGPELSWKYQAGSGDNDWLTPILRQCGDAFDIVSIHRYPYAATQAKLSSAMDDAKKYRWLVGQLQDTLKNTTGGEKPLALTEMNIAYDKTWCTLDASPGTVGAALWLADSVGTSLELGLWTSAVWSIGDANEWSLGLVGPAPGFVPRPAYYSYALYADHFGPSLVDVTSAPAGVNVHASRNADNDATQLIVINWLGSTTLVPFQIVGLPSASPSATFTLPATSMAAIEIPDNGPARAWVYGEAERQASVGPQPLAPGAAGSHDAGAATTGGAGKAVGSGCGVATNPDAKFVATVDGGIATTCGLVPPEAIGNLAVADNYIQGKGVHGYGGPWAWKGETSQATICVTPLCTTSDAFGFVAVDQNGAAPLSAEPVVCTPTLPSSAICIAGSMTRDPSYYSMAAVGMNLNQDPAGAAHGVAVTESITVTTQLIGEAKGNNSLRLQLVDMAGNFYCVDAKAWKSGEPIPIARFRKQCWDSSVPNAAAPVGTMARHFSVFLPGGLTDQEFSFCMLDLAVK